MLSVLLTVLIAFTVMPLSISAKAQGSIEATLFGAGFSGGVSVGSSLSYTKDITNNYSIALP